MLVLLGKTVLSRRAEKCRTLTAFIFGDHLFSAAGISGERKAAKAGVGLYNSLIYQGKNKRNKAGGVTAGIGDAF